MKLRIQTSVAVLLGILALGACADIDPVAPAPASTSLSAAKASKVSVCHRTGKGFNLISVAAPAVPAHVGHGDLVVGAPHPDSDGMVTADCGSVRLSLDPTSTYDTPIHGVASAATFVDECPAGYVGVGLSGLAGTWHGGANHWNVALECRELLPDGTLGASVTLSGHGSGALTEPMPTAYDASCTSDQLLVGVSGSWSPFGISSLEGDCATALRVAGGTGGADSSIGPFDGTGFGFVTAFAEACPDGYVVTGLIGRFGAILDAVGFRCTEVVVQAV